MDALSGVGMSSFGASNVKMLKVVDLPGNTTVNLGTFSFIYIVIMCVNESDYYRNQPFIMCPNQSTTLSKFTVGSTGQVNTTNVGISTTANTIAMPKYWYGTGIVYQIT